MVVACVVNAIAGEKIEDRATIGRGQFHAFAASVLRIQLQQVEQPDPLRIDVIGVILKVRFLSSCKYPHGKLPRLALAGAHTLTMQKPTVALRQIRRHTLWNADCSSGFYLMTRKTQITLASLALASAVLLAQTSKTDAPGAFPKAVASDSITGKILYSGPPPVLKHHSLNSEPDCDKKHPAGIMSQEVVVNSGHTLQNVLVYVKDGLPNKQYPVPATPVKVDQSGCMFLPHVIAVMVNQPVQFLNSDAASHNVHAMPAVNRDWNVAQDKGSIQLTKFPKFEIGMPVRCNIHRWMQMYINVLSNPFFAVTGKDGTFTIKGLPPGEYTIEAWQEKFGTQTLKVRTGARADFTFKG